VNTPNKHASKIATTICTVVLFLSADTVSADTLPAEEAINSLAENAKLTADTFMQQSFKMRMQYEYSDKFLTENDKENLHKLAKNACDKLQAIAKKQETLKRQIEDYQGDDWDKKYGSTGLWRKLSVDIYTTKLGKFEIDYYLALASEHQQRDQILHLILCEIDAIVQSNKQFGPNLIRGKTLALLAQTEPSYKDAAVREFEAFAVYSDIYHPIAAAIEKMKLLSRADTNQLNILVKRLRSNWNDRYLELILSLMFLQRQYDPEGFEKTVSLWPQTKDFIGSLVLSDLSHRIEQQQSLQQISIFEAELAALAIWKDETKNYKELLNCLSNTEKFQTPLILYVTAMTLAESSPARAVNLLIKASKLQQQENDILNIESYKIAEQAAQLAYNLFIQEEGNCQLVLGAFENYYTIADEKIDEEMEYLYAIILNNCSRNTKAKEVLEKIANRPAGNWRDRARLDLILQAMQKASNSTRQQQSELLEKLGDFILSCHGRDENSNKLRAEAITIYCQSLLESKDKASAEKVLEILTKAEATRGINLDLFKAQALQQLARFDESAHYMLLAVQDDSGSLAPIVLELLSEVVEKIDEFETEPANPYSPQMENCKKLAKFCYSTLNDRQSGLFLAEISIFAADKNEEKLLEADKLLNHLAGDSKDIDVDLLRCRARLFCERAKFDKAAPLWAKIAKTQKNKLPQADQQSWRWWRAKYYELYCWSQYTQTEKEEVLHTIEVLENSFTSIPPLWSEKLNSLKHLCRSNFSTGK
jgi:hypothetical protein